MSGSPAISQNHVGCKKQSNFWSQSQI